MACAGGLEGRRIAIDGLTATLTDVLVRLAGSWTAAMGLLLLGWALRGGN